MSGLLDDFPAQSREREANLTLSLRRQSGGPSGRRQRETGLARPPDRSLTTKSQTNLVWSVSPASLRAQRCKAGRAHGYVFGVALGDMRSIAPILLISWPGEASRPFGVFGCARAVPDCLASLQSAERTQRELASSISGRGVECSGGNAGKSVIGRGPNCAEAMSL